MLTTTSKTTIEDTPANNTTPTNDTPLTTASTLTTASSITDGLGVLTVVASLSGQISLIESGREFNIHIVMMWGVGSDDPFPHTFYFFEVISIIADEPTLLFASYAFACSIWVTPGLAGTSHSHV